jgi:hypothetical protein
MLPHKPAVSIIPIQVSLSVLRGDGKLSPGIRRILDKKRKLRCKRKE